MVTKRVRKTGDERREEIKESILDIVFTEGMHKLSTRYLAQKVGVSEGALFRHYPTKKAMIEDIIGDVNLEMVSRLKSIAESDKAPQLRLDEYITFTLDYLYHKKGITLILFTEASYQNDEGLKQTMNEIYKSQKQYFTKIIRDGFAEGIWDDTINVENLARLYMGIPVTLNIEMILNSENFDHNSFGEQMKTIILKVLSKI
jgi:AcrR family transcriptional regulator